MKVIKIILIVLIISAIIFGGIKGYNYYNKIVNLRNEKMYNEIEFLRKNQGITTEKLTELSKISTKVVNDTVKVIVEPKDTKTYEGLKEQVIAGDTELREELSNERKAFLESDDKIYIKTDSGETIIIYEDEEGTLQPLTEGIGKIIQHKEIEDGVCLQPITAPRKKLDIKAGGYYDLTEKDYGIILSKELFSIKRYNFNISALSDLKGLDGIKLGADVGYDFNENLELGVGIDHTKDIYVKLEYLF